MQSSLRPKRRAMLLRRAAAEEHEVRQQTLFASEERDEYAAKSRHNPIIADTTARARKAKQSSAVTIRRSPFVGPRHRIGFPPVTAMVAPET